MGKIFCILGKSGSGKDTVFKSLMADKELKLKGVVPYTTRPRRPGETESDATAACVPPSFYLNPFALVVKARGAQVL